MSETYTCSVCKEPDLPEECVSIVKGEGAICKACEFDLMFDDESGEAIIAAAEEHATAAASLVGCTCGWNDTNGHEAECKKEQVWLDDFDEQVSR